MTGFISDVFVILWFSFCILNHDMFYFGWMYYQLETFIKNCDRFYFRWMYCQLETFIKNYDRFYFRCICNLMIFFLYFESWQILFQVNVFSIRNLKKKIVTGFILDVFVILWFSFCILNHDRFYFRWMYNQLETWKPILKILKIFI